MKNGPLNRLAADCHAANQHWWQDPATGARIQRDNRVLLFLIVSEIVEAGEAARRDAMDSHLPHRRGEEVELADVLIRLFDFAGAYRFDLDRRIEQIGVRQADDADGAAVPLNAFARVYAIKGGYVETDKPVLLYRMARTAGLIDDYRPDNLAAILLKQVFEYAGAFGLDLDGAVAEKRAYNATRADHTNAARLAKGGKKW